jgi:hypothetical protein
VGYPLYLGSGELWPRNVSFERKKADAAVRTRRSERIPASSTIRQKQRRGKEPVAPAGCTGVARPRFYLAKRRIIPWGTRPQIVNPG